MELNGCDLLKNSMMAARSAGLRYVNVDDPGVQRRRRGKGFSYIGLDGKPIRDRETLARIKALAIPPAWTAVWICPDARGHVQATGRDDRGRKQYRYHARWREVRDVAKFEHIIDFDEALPEIRRRVNADLRRKMLSRQKVLAAVVKLLDATRIGVGNEEYARDNHSFGLTTFRPRHICVVGTELEISFRGKSGQRHRLKLDDRRLARVVKHCEELPGQRLFAYVDDDGEIHEIESSDVNDYLRECSGREITSKDFRTWAATVAATLALHVHGHQEVMTHRKRCLTQAVKEAAGLLGNTPAVCRRAYIHPSVIEGYLAGRLCESLLKCVQPRATRQQGLDQDERMVLRFLKRQRRQAKINPARSPAAA